ncbi:a.superbus venom factor 1 [Trichonephila inaurata madagascariensis]|uniref:A.superbus venom factor 1 n=1 Tax=Trichonephila inaurata madagascariensis TaxID=2747483 RepID=A0A8X6X432_9ARAC|nr:a.superbus venom factor 1 [Trichonephila inaurata madagascariensis]GFY45895.1 a.superbus venom factor 1 [Trichonephila inaurata madagascariensis]
MRCCIAIFLAVLSTAWGQTFYVVAPNTLHVADIFEVHVRSEDFPPGFLSTPGEKSVLLTVHSENFHKEIQIPVSNKTGYVFIQTDKPIYTPNQLVHIRVIPLNEDALPSDRPIKLQIKNPNGTTVEETPFTKGKTSKFQTAFARHMYKFPNFPIMGEWTATVHYGYKLEQSSTVHFELQEYVLPTFTVELKTPEIILESDKDIVLAVNAKYVYGEKVRGSVTYRLGVKGEAPQVTYFAIVGPKKLIDGSYEQVVSTNEFAQHKDIGWFPEIEGSHLVVEATVMDDATGNKEVAIDAKGRFSKTPFVISFKRCLQDFKPGLMSVFEADINYINGKPAAKIPTRISAIADGQPLVITEPTSTSDDEGKVSFQIHPQMHHNTISITLETEDPRYLGKQAKGHFLQHRFQSSNKAFIALERSSTHRTKVGDKFVKIVHFDPPVMKNVYYAVITKGKIIKMEKLKVGDYKTQVIDFLVAQDMVPNFRLVVWALYKDELLVDSLNIDTEDTCPPEAEVFIEPRFEATEPGRTGSIHFTGRKSTLVGILGVDKAVYALSEKDVLTRSKVFKTMAKHDLGCGPGGGVTTETVLGNSGILIATNKYTPKPGQSSCVAIKRRKREIASEILSKYEGTDNLCCALGLNKDRFNRNCETRTNLLTRYFHGKHQNCSRIFLECCLYGKEHGFTDMKLMRTGMNLARMGGVQVDDVKFISEEEEEMFEQHATVRTDFRETIFFEDFELGVDGKKEFQVSLPHSITTWMFQAVSVSSSHGICVSEPKSIVSKKKIFLHLNLPYSVVRNEQVEIQATLFNYGGTRISAVMYMYGVKGLCTGVTEGEKSERKRVFVDKRSATTVTFPVIPLDIGTFNLKVVALTSEGSDVIVKPLNVIAEGQTVEFDYPVKLDPTNQQRRVRKDVSRPHFSDTIDESQKLQFTAITLAVSQDAVPGTESCVITAVGDQFGATVETAINEPDKLLQKPRGCGEQNMMFLAPTLYTMKYLKVKGKITPEIEDKGFSFIRLGYGNQLAFRKEDGSYAAFTNRAPSTWLTAFVVKIFCQASQLVHIDEHVMCSGVKWLLDHQQDDGSFNEDHPIYHTEMVGGVQGRTPLTAFVLISLEECKCDIENLHLSKKRALAYLEDHLGDVNEPLAVAIMAYALSLSDSVLKEAANEKLMFLSKYDEGTNTMHWGVDNAAEDIEATSYALLNQLLLNDMEKSNSIVNWLNNQRLQSGSFKSTQDTVIGLQALSEYAIRAQMPAMNLVTNITSNNDMTFSEVLQFNEKNSHILKNIKVNKVGGMLFLNTAGHGVGSLTVKLRYNVFNPPEKLCKFDVTVNVIELKKERNAVPHIVNFKGKDHFDQLLPDDLIRVADKLDEPPEDYPVLDIDPRNRVAQKATLVAQPPKRSKRQAGKENSKLILKITICARYLGNKTTGMSIIDAGIFSGFVPNEDDLKELQDDPKHFILRYETSSKGIVFYLKEVPTKERYCFHFHVHKDYHVGNTQRSLVKIYDYYNPDATCSVFYSPTKNSALLRTICDGGVCQCAEGGCPPKNPFEIAKTFELDEKEIGLINYACNNFDYVWKGQFISEKNEGGFLKFGFQIEEVIKAGIESKELIEGDTRYLLQRDNCAPWVTEKDYLIMGKDGNKYKNDEGQIWYRYLLDQTSAVYMWKSKEAGRRGIQRLLSHVIARLKRDGCLE